MIQISISFLLIFQRIFDGCWPHVGPQDPPKIDKKSINYPSETLTKSNDDDEET